MQKMRVEIARPVDVEEAMREHAISERYREQEEQDEEDRRRRRRIGIWFSILLLALMLMILVPGSILAASLQGKSNVRNTVKSRQQDHGIMATFATIQPFTNLLVMRK